MSATVNELAERFRTFLAEYYAEDVAELAQHYPSEQRSLFVDFADLYRFDADLAEDWLREPEQVQEYAEEGLRLYDLPAAVNLADAHVRLGGLDETDTFYPGGFSPAERHSGGPGREARPYVAIQGEVAKSSETYPKLVRAAFECQRCGTVTDVPQADGDYEEPHECPGCERQGPFKIQFAESEFVDAQKARIQEPPEVSGGNGATIDVYFEDDLASEVQTGDRVTVAGVLQLQQQTKGREKTAKFETYLDGEAVELEESDHTSIDVSPEEREEIEAIANGEYGDPLELAVQSMAPKILGYDHIKRAALLQLVGGSRVVHPDGSADRGDIHMLLLGDPGTAKSKIISWVEKIAPRAVGVSGQGGTGVGLTASAVRDDFGEGEWALEAGAFVKANGGIVCLDEIDDMPEETRASMLEPMSKQSIHINKAGINTHLATRTAVIAGGNPKYGRFDEYEPLPEQFDLEATLLSRFDVIYTLVDKPDPDSDAELSDHIIQSREAAKKAAADGGTLTQGEREAIETPIDGDLLRKYIALAKRQPAPTFESDAQRQKLAESFTRLRSANGYDQDSPVPTTFRKLEAIHRIAEADARFRFSETIGEESIETAQKVVGRSMQDIGRNEDGDLDTDVVETGTSKPQQELIQVIERVIQEAEREDDAPGANREDVLDALEADGFDRDRADGQIDTLGSEEGALYAPDEGRVKWLGR